MISNPGDRQDLRDYFVFR